jgi:thiol-disulfide isomerase/thioredoxin
MHKKTVAFMLTILILMIACVCRAEMDPPPVGSTFPDIELLKPGNSSELKYLGLAGSGNFKISQIKADVVIIEIFSMYCPYCQGEAPHINNLYAFIENSPIYKNKIKMIGIAINNSLFEAEIFKNKYKVKFPLIPDGDFKLHKTIGQVRTPYFFAVKLADGKAEVIYSRAGVLGDYKAFLEQISKSAWGK